MMELTSDTVLALHALHLLMIKTKAVSIAEIRASSGFPLERIAAVLGRLKDAGLIRTDSDGRFALLRAPGEISIRHVVDAVGEPHPPTAPCGGDFDACATRASCILAPLCRAADQGYQATLRSFTIAELMGLPPDLPNCLAPASKAG